MRRLLLWTIAAAALGASVPVVAGGSAFELEAVGVIDVGPDGSVRDYALETRLQPQVAGLVDRTVRSWKFEPVLVDGRPVIASTRMRLELEAVPDGDGYALRVADVAFGEPQRRNTPPPTYPRVALGEHVGAMVSLLLQLDAAGRVKDVHVEQVSLTERKGKRDTVLRERFADESRKAALAWTFDTGEIVDGEPVAVTIRVPVEFGPWQAGDWKERPEYIPGPYQPAPWASAPDGGIQAARDGDLQPLDSRLRLRDDVVGSML